MRYIKLCLLTVMILHLTGCATAYYYQVNKGQLSGELKVRWIKPDRFVFEPVEDDPLTFIRTNGDIIQPGEMYTDGGSVPRPLWILKDYSPWGYAPAFIIHDWLFNMHRCKLEGYEKYTLDDAALIMSEVIKTMMEEYGTVSPLTLYSMDRAVRSEIARQIWDGECQKVTPRMLIRDAEEWIIKFPAKEKPNEK